MRASRPSVSGAQACKDLRSRAWRPPGPALARSKERLSDRVAPFSPYGARAVNYRHVEPATTDLPLAKAGHSPCGVGVQWPTPPEHALGDFVWNDLNRDGIQQPGEPGVPGVRAELLDGTGRVIRDKEGDPVAVTSDSTGHYLFQKLPAGEYAVHFDLSTVPIGAVATLRDAGEDRALDSDADPTTGITPDGAADRCADGPGGTWARRRQAAVPDLHRVGEAQGHCGRIERTLRSANGARRSPTPGSARRSRTG